MKTITLELAEEPGTRAVVRISGVPVGELYGIQERTTPIPGTRAKFRALAKAFAPYLVSWTLPGDPTAEGLEAIDFNLALAIINGWLRGVASAPLPLLVTSSDGEPSEALPDSPSP